MGFRSRDHEGHSMILLSATVMTTVRVWCTTGESGIDNQQPWRAKVNIPCPQLLTVSSSSIDVVTSLKRASSYKEPQTMTLLLPMLYNTTMSMTFTASYPKPLPTIKRSQCKSEINAIYHSYYSKSPLKIAHCWHWYGRFLVTTPLQGWRSKVYLRSKLRLFGDTSVFWFHLC